MLTEARRKAWVAETHPDYPDWWRPLGLTLAHGIKGREEYFASMLSSAGAFS